MRPLITVTVHSIGTETVRADERYRRRGGWINVAGRQTNLSDKSDGIGNQLPVALRQIGTTGKIPLHGDPKSVA
jgi:hypothetical protein